MSIAPLRAEMATLPYTEWNLQGIPDFGETIAKTECLDLHAYLLVGRGTGIGVFNAEAGLFLGLHEHMGEYDVARYYHNDDGDILSTSSPKRDLGPIPKELGLKPDKVRLYAGASAIVDGEYFVFMKWLTELGIQISFERLAATQEVYNRALFDGDSKMAEFYGRSCEEAGTNIMYGFELIEHFKRGSMGPRIPTFRELVEAKQKHN